MKRRHRSLTGLLTTTVAGAITVMAPAPLAGQDTPAAEEKKNEPLKPPPPDTVLVKTAPFEVAVTFDAIVEAEETAAISVAPKEWADLTIVKVVSHGQKIKKGDPLVSFDTEKLDRQITDAAAAQPEMEVALALQKLEFAATEESAPLDREAAKRANEIASEALTYFEQVSRTMQEKAAAQSLKRAAFSVESAREELEQLQKMYEADDLTEETEEIILKRAQNALESAEFFHTQAEERTKRNLETTLPREHVTLTDAAERAALAHKNTESSLPVTVQQKRLALEKAQRDFVKAVEKLERLRADRKMLEVTAPFSGIVYYGQADRGKWATAAAVKKKLKPGGKVTPHEVFMTVVQPGAAQLRATVPEDKFSPLLNPGVTGKAHLKSDPLHKVAVRVTGVGLVPLPEGGFDASLEFEQAPGAAWVPGRSAAVNLVLYRNESAIAIPATAVRQEGDREVVTVIDGSGVRSDREVQTGRRSGDKVEVTGGLNAGETVATKP